MIQTEQSSYVLNDCELILIPADYTYISAIGLTKCPEMDSSRETYIHVHGEEMQTLLVRHYRG
jgi:hypothetical protein